MAHTPQYLRWPVLALSLFVLACGSSGSGTDATPACVEGATRCQAADVEICQAGEWGLEDTCNPGIQHCEEGVGQASCVFNPTCIDSQKNQDETDVDCGGAVCGPCDDGSACTVDGDCTSDACDNGICQICKVGEIDCHGNLIRKCNADQQSYETLATCVLGQVCNAATQSCDAVQVVGTPEVTGKYFLYANFKIAGGVFKGGNDVDSFVFTLEGNNDNRIYVNRNSQLDVYSVELLDSDGDGDLEPNQHPDNPDDMGPMEQRVLTFLQTYDSVTLGRPSGGEIYAVADRIFFIRDNAVWSFDFATETTTSIIPAVGTTIALLGFDELAQRWFMAYDGGTRQVESYFPDGGGLSTQFRYPEMAGGHMDGMEVVVDPREDISYVYVSDMTSDFLLQYAKDPITNEWVQKNVFEYDETDGQPVEGMGFGAFNHFWITSWDGLYEVGGGDLQDYVGGGID